MCHICDQENNVGTKFEGSGKLRKVETSVLVLETHEIKYKYWVIFFCVWTQGDLEKSKLMTHLVKEQEKVMLIKRLSSAGLFTQPHYKVNLSGDYSGNNILPPIPWVFSCAGLFGAEVVDVWW